MLHHPASSELPDHGLEAGRVKVDSVCKAERCCVGCFFCGATDAMQVSRRGPVGIFERLEPVVTGPWRRLDFVSASRVVAAQSR